MNSVRRTIFMISADATLAQACIDELTGFRERYRTHLASSLEKARKGFGRVPPSVIFLDESAVDPRQEGESLALAVAGLAEIAPVVVAGTPERQGDLAFLITAGAVDFVARTGNFHPIVAGMLDRRMRMAERVTGMVHFPNDELTGDFGEILRHEVNNPLTGILGNTELLLARRDRLPPGAIERLQTIAELAVRLRETVRRLSNAWDERHEHARPA
jgi:signal transduction histidine kinase